MIISYNILFLEFSNNSSEISGDPILKISTHEEKKDKKIHSKK